MPQNMQYVNGRIGLGTSFNSIRGAFGGELSSEVVLAMAFVANANYTHVNYELRPVLKSMRALNVTKCITFIGKIEKVAFQ